MRSKLLVAILGIMLLGGCKKDNAPINFSCYVAGEVINGNKATFMNGNAQTVYNIEYDAFQIVMAGPSSQSVVISWYGLDSVGAVTTLTPKTYSMPAHIYPPTYVSGAYTVGYTSASYSTGGGGTASGTVTITKNTGPGGVISGTFSFNALDAAGYPYSDTVYVTQGTFTNVPIISQ